MLITEFPILAISAFERPDARLVTAACRAGALGILDVGRNADTARRAITAAAKRCPDGFGIRVPEGVTLKPKDLPEQVTCVVLPYGVKPAAWKKRKITTVVQVTTVEEARNAAAAGVAGLIVKGAESGGRVSSDSSFVLLQQVLDAVDAPVWVQGGVGLHTAAACIAGGAAGVVLDSQLALTRESSIPESVKAAIGGMDGSETIVISGYRVFTRPDLPVADMADLSADQVVPQLGGDDLRKQLIAAGQDAAFARPLTDRFHTAGGVITAIKDSIDSHLRQARAHRPLAPDSPLAVEHGIKYPIAQGPMTRVSDRAGFADAVSRGGGLPFLALSLMRGEQVRALLQETAALLGDRPWGVGILGFVPPSLREEQMAALQEFNPPVALIAGGRPSQTRPLEAAGTRTYLHVPSPGLLALFLRDGARRFVFEGRECGGHVGPRSSFALWEAQIERLLEFESPEELNILFAGGIHDDRSAAMVAAMAAPLAAAGAKVGVLMGTAYLFTEEIVGSGAILPGFQKAALDCDKTVLLETAPGHATRCVETDYVRAFRAEKGRLEREGASPQEVWAALEQLNLGRLRIAAKGIRRDGPELVDVGEKAQASQGMFMIGQVATMRDKTLSIADLHADVSAGSQKLLRKFATREHARSTVPPVDVAVVGMSCAFPDALDVEAFWGNVVLGRNAITEVPEERWSADIYYDADSMDGTKTPSKWGGFLGKVAFDPLEYGIPPRSLAAIEPVQLLSLEMARRALSDAGYAEREFDRESTSVIFGAEAGTDLAGGYGFRNLYPQIHGELPPALDEALPSLTEDSFPGVLANVIAGRIANRLDLGGSNFTVDAACASSLAAVDMAVKELVTGTSNMVLCGGADLHNSINDYLMFSSVHALSRNGQCSTFDANADGITLGEGVGVVVLKRLADAERDGDRVYAVIKGVGASSDGRSLGLTAPRKDGQVRALERAYRRAGVSPAEIGLVEAHGTGTVVGDRTELATLTEVFGTAGVEPGSCALGSVKSQIGHTKCAAGIAGLIKVALSLHHKVLPPTLNIETPNPYWHPQNSPFVFHQTASPWLGEERHAAVSAFGFGGTNFHVVLSEHQGWEEPAVGFDAWPSELFLFKGESRDAAAVRIQRLATLVATEDAWRLRDLARSITTTGSGPVQVALVATDIEDLRRKLARAARFEPDPRGVFVAGDHAADSKVAFLFPGQGSQRPGMLRDLFVAFPEFQRYLEYGAQWAQIMLPPAAFAKDARDEQKRAITDTRVAQPTLGMAGLAMAEALYRVGVRADMMGGHSYGELVALCVSGAIDEADLLEISAARGECILAATGEDPGTMAAVSAGADAIEPLLDGLKGVVIANRNAPKQTVISGPTDSIDEALALIRGAGLKASSIPVACAFHSEVVAGARETFLKRLDGVRLARLGTDVWSNTTAAPYKNEPAAIREQLGEHIVNPVRFVEQIEAMYEAGARVFVEAGPGRVLTGLVGRILGDKPHVAVACDRGRGSTLTHLQLALGELAVHGVHIDAAALYQGRDAAAFDLDYPPAVAPGPTAWLVDGFMARPVRGELPAAAMRPITAPIVSASVGMASPHSERDSVMLEYLGTMSRLVETQREVMLGYLGRHPAPAVAELPGEIISDAEVVEVTEIEQPKVIDLREALLGIVSERTGYPVEMLDMDLDLEADLSIDSIKRIEILGALGEQLGLAGGDGGSQDEMIEELAGIKTLRAIVAWLEANQAQAHAEADAPTDETVREIPEFAEAEETVAAPELTRYVLSVENAPSVDEAVAVEGLRFAIVRDQLGVAELLAERLERSKAIVQTIDMGESPGEVDGLVFLASLTTNGADPVMPLFEATRAAVAGGASTVLAATGFGGEFGRTGDHDGPLPRGGASGLMKTVAKEYPDLHVRVVDLCADDSAETLAAHVFTELVAGGDLVEVGYHEGVRHMLNVVAQPRRAPNGSAKELDSEAVVLITGGARGITAGVAIELARRFRCNLELVGRSPRPSHDVPADLADAADAAAIRKVLLARGELKTPKEIERATSRALADRQMRETFAAIDAAGGSVTYHSVDVRDSEAFGDLIDGIYTRQGRLDGVVHGAGVLEDKLLKDKTADSFTRVFDTKVEGARTLADRLRDDVGFVVFFSSVSGAFGNRGQVDYAAANAALDKLALSLDERLAGRVVSINWGPWAGDGMVSDELEREYARRGIGLIAPDGGVEAFVDELTDGHREDAQVIFMRAEPESLL